MIHFFKKFLELLIEGMSDDYYKMLPPLQEGNINSYMAFKLFKYYSVKFKLKGIQYSITAETLI